MGRYGEIWGDMGSHSLSYRRPDQPERAANFPRGAGSAHLRSSPLISAHLGARRRWMGSLRRRKAVQVVPTSESTYREEQQE